MLVPTPAASVVCTCNIGPHLTAVYVSSCCTTLPAPLHSRGCFAAFRLLVNFIVLLSLHPLTSPANRWPNMSAPADADATAPTSSTSCSIAMPCKANTLPVSRGWHRMTRCMFAHQRGGSTYAKCTIQARVFGAAVRSMLRS
jgi:hypothetical protein